MSKIIYSGDYEALQTMEMVLPPKAQREWIDKELHVTEDDGRDFVQRMNLESVNTNPATRNTLKPVLDELEPQTQPAQKLEMEFEGFFAERHNAEEVLYRSRKNGAEAFLDKGMEIRFLSAEPAEREPSIQAALELAKERGWRELEVTGTEDFRRQVWMEASLAGIQVKGYVPSPEDKAELEKLRPGSSPAPVDPAPEAKIAAVEPAQKPEESITATEQDHKLVQQATEKREANGGYQPSLEELRAIDRVLIEKTKDKRKERDMEAVSGEEKEALFPDSKARADHELFAKLGSAKERLDASKDRPEPNRGNDLAADHSRPTHNGPGR